MRAVRWTWQERIPGGALSLVPGREGIGKSPFACWLTAQVTNGTLPGTLHGRPCPVIYAATEDSWSHTVVPRLAAAGAGLDAVFRVDVAVGDHELGLTLPFDCEALGEVIAARGVGMVVLDPLLSTIADSIDTHKDRQLRRALEPLVRMADDTGCAVVGLAHFSKAGGSDALTLITGSRAFAAVSRAVLAVALDDDTDDGSCVISQAKNNLGRMDLPSLRYRIESATVTTDDGPSEVGRLHMLGETDRNVRDILADAGSDQEARSERDEAVAWLRAYLADQGGSVKAGEAIKAARADGIAEATLKRARKKAGVYSRRVHGFGKGSVWSLESEDPPFGSRSDHSDQPPERDPNVIPIRKPGLVFAPWEPAIWRRLSLPGDTSLDVLHRVVQVAFGWESCHLHQFEARGRRYADTSFGDSGGALDERRSTLAAVAPRVGSRLRYTYDFGDDWEHDIVVEAVDPAEPEPRVACLDGERAGPPEDSGGIFAYRDMLEALGDPKHPDHEDHLEWVGEDFDPEAVDRKAISTALAFIPVPGGR